MPRVSDEELVAQVAAAIIVRAAAARVQAPESLRTYLAEHASDAIPPRPAAGTTGMTSFPIAARRATARTPWWLATRRLGALATLAVGAVHLQQYFKLYSDVPTIGTLFVLNFVGATVIGLALLAPVERLAGPAAVVLLAVSAIGLAATSFVFLLISEHTPLFGFREPGYDPAGIAAARISEVATVVLLGAFLVAGTSQHRRSS